MCRLCGNGWISIAFMVSMLCECTQICARLFAFMCEGCGMRWLKILLIAGNHVPNYNKFKSFDAKFDKADFISGLQWIVCIGNKMKW